MPNGHAGQPIPLSGRPAAGDPGTVAPIEPPFAEAKDLEERWHALTPDEQAKAKALIADASDLIVTTCPNWNKASAATLKRITCAIVKRAMLARDDMAGVSQGTQTAGSYSESLTWANPSGDIYLTASEKESLGGDGVAWAYDTASRAMR
ncbi:MAG: Gp19/Gp15/Gp42 family protein [Bifidobacterium scardovii]|jgi:hypothetical protein|uniref:Gp19/Gp15/Gp42 family protein n=1 Tax=Bifidobacterium scardovii TaxID=158787 RepID=UPI002060102E|nr:Gp19/Gp15/Gp42 family protein [Bifidobacterium scardovii]MDU2421297.1 Gp19/Gp15/Gp42 family protein [Bifidobacterium scardovii]DAZ29427.1 MAG TPA: hypothetical protein [Caudoviricetes sp.]